MTSPRRTRINKHRKKKLMKTGGLFLFLLLVTVFIMIWTVTAHHREKESVKSAPAAQSDSDQTQQKKEKTQKEKTPKSIDHNKQISNYLQQIGFSGTAMVVKDGKVVLKKGFGYANRKQKIKNNPETSYYVGSSQKALIATAVLQLEEKGLLQTSDTVSTYLPNFPNGTRITLKNLLNHTSGINGHIEGQGPISPIDLIKDIEYRGIKRQPGVWEYRDSNYSVLAYIVSQVSGESYEQYIKDHVFKPAGMKHAGFYKTFAEAKYPAVGYKVDESGRLVTPHLLDLSQLYGAGDMYMSAEDLYKFDKAVVNGTLLSKESFTKMFTAGSSSAYGMGFYIDPGSYSNHGVMPGYNILNSFSHSASKYVILLSNIQNNAKLGQVNNRIYQLLNQAN
ncbi:penicillin-binding protein [Bacillus amyloliquefaciens]|uniref:serine hydrolase domain-containing protein n=1 Tax=Bacillus amyloliquefaciens group TaxID=1938374 RepID=UPI000B51A37E|nr:MULTISPECIES: serine hydrolase domain-containing protein [Bacillus amyloliquefaciens group]ASF28892.1 penicillin-binding protein [Bacillus amyloliquefaciens]